MLKTEVWLEDELGEGLFAMWYTPEEGPWRRPLFFLHGLGTDGREFGPVPFMLAKAGIPCLALDFSGHGRSKGKSGYLSKAIHRNNMSLAIKFIARQGYDRVWVLGHSFGAHAALMAAVELTQVDAVILVAPQLRSGESLKGLRRWMFQCVGIVYSLFPFLPSLRLPNHTSYQELFSTPEVAREAEMTGFIAPYLNLKICAYAIKADNRRLARCLNKPALFIACGADRHTPQERVELLAAEAPSGVRHIITLPHSGHSPFLDLEQRDLVEAILTFYRIMLESNP